MGVESAYTPGRPAEVTGYEMISQPLFIMIILGFVTMLLVWSAARRLIQDQAPIVVAFPDKTMRDLIKILVAAPLVISALHLLLAFALGARGDAYAELAQGLFYLGWWAGLTVMAFALLVARRAGTAIPGSAYVGMLLSAGVLALFTSPDLFAQTFSVDGYDRAIIVGFALMLMAYTVLRRLWRGRTTK